MASGIDSTDFSEDLTSKKRKRLSIAKAAPMDSKTEGTTNKKGKCYTVGEGTKEKDDSNDKNEESDSAQTSEICPGKVVDNARFSVPVKQDYIHVRSRRGQATDSHSLAERVRREKISERMKILQDLVPGCNKVTGKAVMLDEIINYVQSLQCQVEFLSMKLAALNPQLDFNMEGRYLTKDTSRVG